MVDAVSSPNRVGAVAPLPAPAVSPTFGVGQQHVGAVLRVLPQGGVLAELHGQHLILEPGLSFAPGETFFATVQQVTPTLVLQLRRGETTAPVPETALPPPHATSGHPQTTIGSVLTAAQLKTYLTASQPLGASLSVLEQLLTQHPFLQEIDAPLVQSLRDTLTVLRPQGEVSPDAAQLREQVERSGLNYEKKAERALQGETTAMTALGKDWKGQLLALSHRLEQVMHGTHARQAQEAADILPQVTRALENVEFQQVVNQLAPAEHDPVVLSLLQTLTATTQPMALAVQREAHARTPPEEAPERYSLVLQLDLTGLGTLRIAATVYGNEVSTTFQVRTPDVAAMVQDTAPELVASLRGRGFEAQVACEVQPRLVSDATLHMPACPDACHASGGCDHMTQHVPELRRAAVALKYDAATDSAPKVVAKGRGLVAEHIIALAHERGIPMREDPDLVQLLTQIDLDQAIPPTLYTVVAELLAFIYRLNQQYPPPVSLDSTVKSGKNRLQHVRVSNF